MGELPNLADVGCGSGFGQLIDRRHQRVDMPLQPVDRDEMADLGENSFVEGDLLGSLGRCLAAEMMEPRRTQGGAGLGLFHAYMASSQLAFNIAHGLRTEAIGILDIASSNKEFKAKPKSLTMFQSSIRDLKPVTP